MNLIGSVWGVCQLKLHDDVYYESTAAKSRADKKLATAEVQVQGRGRG